MAQTGERESAVLGTMFVLEKFDISINIGKCVMCVCVCVCVCVLYIYIYIYIYIYLYSVRSAHSRDGSVDYKEEIKTSRHAKTGSWQ